MKKRHTPGPWRIGQDKALIVAGPHGLHIARAAQVGMPNCEANARLIAAAPDLLAALRMLLEEFEDRFDMDNPSTNPGIKVAAARVRKLLADIEDEI